MDLEEKLPCVSRARLGPETQATDLPTVVREGERYPRHCAESWGYLLAQQGWTCVCRTPMPFIYHLHQYNVDCYFTGFLCCDSGRIALALYQFLLLISVWRSPDMQCKHRKVGHQGSPGAAFPFFEVGMEECPHQLSELLQSRGEASP